MRADGLENHIHAVVEALESLIFRRRVRVVEFARAVAHVACPGDLRADVVVQVAGQVQNQVAETIAKEERVLPELGFGQRRGQLAYPGCVRSIAVGES